MTIEEWVCPYCGQDLAITKIGKLAYGCYILTRCGCEGEDGCWGHSDKDAKRRLLEILWKDYKKRLPRKVLRGA